MEDDHESLNFCSGTDGGRGSGRQRASRKDVPQTLSATSCVGPQNETTVTSRNTSRGKTSETKEYIK